MSKQSSGNPEIRQKVPAHCEFSLTRREGRFAWRARDDGDVVLRAR